MTSAIEQVDKLHDGLMVYLSDKRVAFLPYERLAELVIAADFLNVRDEVEEDVSE